VESTEVRTTPLIPVSPSSMRLPKVLYITAPANDFLADSLLHGLRCLLGVNVVDFPRCRYLDASLDDRTRATMHGRGFTLYGRRPDAEGDAVDRERVWERAASGEFDLVVISSIWRQYEHLLDHRIVLRRCRTVLIDSEDRAMWFPWSGAVAGRGLWRMFRAAVSARGMPRFVRERPDTWFPRSMITRPWSVLQNTACLVAFSIHRPRRISFSIPEDLIVSKIPEKSQLMFDHVVDEQTARFFPGSSVAPPYCSEPAYFQALRRSRFAVTRKRAGWDCLRHYEIAASGCVPCFRFLDRKPPACAPDGLGSSNCISYHDPQELLDRIKVMSDEEYKSLADGAISWARKGSTRVRAQEFLQQLGIDLSPDARAVSPSSATATSAS
jgi:hypothetical protein